MFAQVALGDSAAPTLLVPSEAVIRTGTRTIVMLATGDGRYHPAEVRAGREAGGQTELFDWGGCGCAIDDGPQEIKEDVIPHSGPSTSLITAT